VARTGPPTANLVIVVLGGKTAEAGVVRRSVGPINSFITIPVIIIARPMSNFIHHL